MTANKGTWPNFFENKIISQQRYFTCTWSDFLYFKFVVLNNILQFRMQYTSSMSSSIIGKLGTIGSGHRYSSCIQTLLPLVTKQLKRGEEGTPVKFGEQGMAQIRESLSTSYGPKSNRFIFCYMAMCGTGKCFEQLINHWNNT